MTVQLLRSMIPPWLDPDELNSAVFHGGLERLEDAYRTTMGALAQQKQRAIDAVQGAYETPGGPPEGLSHEDDLLIVERPLAMAILDQEFEETSRLIRETFMTALFHFWERQSGLWLNNPRAAYSHANVMGWLERKGFKPDKQAMRRLQLAVNCFKHGAGESCDKLRTFDPTLFEPPRIKNIPNLHLLITAEVLDGMFEAVWRSGPIKIRAPGRGPYLLPANLRRTAPRAANPSEPSG